tara:strand:- start:125 stop:340 length:216 start_codon:yes stop_codon:yes gene_type:complete
MPGLMRRIEDFGEFLFREQEELLDGESVIPIWAMVPEGYSPRKTFRGFLKFTFQGERDPKNLYDRLPENSY